MISLSTLLPHSEEPIIYQRLQNALRAAINELCCHYLIPSRNFSWKTFLREISSNVFSPYWRSWHTSPASWPVDRGAAGSSIWIIKVRSASWTNLPVSCSCPYCANICPASLSEMFNWITVLVGPGGVASGNVYKHSTVFTRPSSF